MFQELGAFLIDADLAAHQVVEPGKPAWKEIVAHFGPDIVFANQQLDRKKLGGIIFNQPEERRVLNRIIHPRVIEAMRRQEQQFHHDHPETLVIADVPLLIEADMHRDYPYVIVVYVPEDIQLHRLVARDQISAAEAEKRIYSQMPLAEKVTYATHIINNNESRENTRRQVVGVYHEITGILS